MQTMAEAEDTQVDTLWWHPQLAHCPTRLASLRCASIIVAAANALTVKPHVDKTHR